MASQPSSATSEFIKQARAAEEAKPRVAVPKVDEYLGDRELETACDELRTGSFAGAAALLTSRNNGDWTVSSIARDDIEIDVYECWSQAAPSAETLTILATAHIAHGWKARGTGLGDTVSFRDGLTLHQHLAKAEEILHQATLLDPTCAEPYVQLITVAMATGGDQEVIQQHFMAAHERVPFHPLAVIKALQAKCQKWGGDNDSMMAFARWVGEHAPNGSSALVAPLEAHYESRIFELKTVGELTAAMDAPEVAEEVLDCFERFLDGMADPALPQDVKALNTFLHWVAPSCMRSAELNQRGFRLLANRPTEAPWDMTGKGDPVGRFQKIQQHRIKHSGVLLSSLTTVSDRLDAAGEFGRPELQRTN